MPDRPRLAHRWPEVNKIRSGLHAPFRRAAVPISALETVETRGSEGSRGRPSLRCYGPTPTHEDVLRSNRRSVGTAGRQGPDLVAVQPSILRAEAMPVRVALQNVSDTTISLRPSFVFGAWLDAEIEGPNGALIARSAHIDPGMEARIDLGPGDRTEAIVDINCPVESPTAPGGCIRPYSLDEKGAYVVKMRYSYPCGGQPCKSNLTVEAIDAVPFEIVVR